MRIHKGHSAPDERRGEAQQETANARALGGQEIVTVGLVHELIADAELTPAILLIDCFMTKW